MKDKPKAKLSEYCAMLMDDILSPDYTATGKILISDLVSWVRM
jgi:hypothetical protein